MTDASVADAPSKPTGHRSYGPDTRRSGGIASALAHEAHDLVRAFAGAYLFGIPLLLTMETWERGRTAPPGVLLALVGLALAASFGLVRVIGFKRETTFGSRADQAVHAVAVGVVASMVCLLVLNRIGPDDPPAAIAGMLAVQALPMSLGAAVANAIFKRGEDRHGGGDEGSVRRLLHQLGAAAAGAALVSLSAASTEEIPLLAAGLTPGHQAALLVFSLALTHAIVFQSGFHPDQRQRAERGRSRAALAVAHASETASAYVVALAVAFASLLLFNQAELGDPITVLLTQTLVLGLPATIGAAAGRLVL